MNILRGYVTLNILFDGNNTWARSCLDEEAAKLYRIFTFTHKGMQLGGVSDFCWP